MTTQITQTNGNKLRWNIQGVVWSDSFLTLRTWRNSYDAIDYVAAVDESLALVSTPARKSLRGFEESFGFTETFVKSIGKNNVEPLELDESLEKGIEAVNAESFEFADRLVKSVGRTSVESFEFEESFTKGVGKSNAESWGFEDSLGKTILRNAVESFGLIGPFTKDTAKQNTETLNLDETPSAGLTKRNAETLGFSEDCESTETYARNFIEHFTIFPANYGKLLNWHQAARTWTSQDTWKTIRQLVDQPTKIIGKNIIVPLPFMDTIRQMGDMAMSDDIIASNEITLSSFADFMDSGGAAGFENWRDFVPGDYEYREALVRIVLESKNNDRGLLTGLQAVVDVPDVIDRGSASVSDAANGVVVEYNKQFHIVPEITLSARAGTGNPSIAELVGFPTTHTFTARLRDSVTGLLVAGQFSWMAHGY